jgi:hypothetical protein
VNALLRHQPALLKRQSKRPQLKPADRLSLLLLAKVTRTWHQTLLIVQPATLLRWHRDGHRLFWKWRCRKRKSQSWLSEEMIALIRRMAEENPLWGAERIRGELLKLGIEVAKRTIQRYVPQNPAPREPSQNWATFLKTHAKDVWECDFVPVNDLLFRQLFVLFIVELASRRVVHFGVTRPEPILGCATTERSDSGRTRTAIQTARQRQQVWQRVRCRGAGDGYRGVMDADQGTASECDRGTVYRQYAPRVLGSHADLR